ncbi:TonB-dependent receptor family protein [Spirosoma linguale]|uniref:TonB-dependent receptor n=1 Tax=Spirosoma linguale (strain ATCC 33905 / DSM 74 / LMG 10896 / Claus 1) TaxID=504472 RepID=D2QV68_SPILD|nr:TonB-dependent receptor [Spirosoma linguale DSM 74]
MSRLCCLLYVCALQTGYLAISAKAQTSADTLKTHILDPITVEGRRQAQTDPLPDVHGTYLLAGKRSEIIRLTQLDANITQKTARQLFARIPGVFVYDMDGTGNQINMATRGLDPHRSWELNIRQNGIGTNSDMYGYPASHYSPPTESIERVELVRGTGSLQYGAQFGGMINYVTKGADTTRRFGFESINAVGSFGFRSTYNAIGGRVSRLTYYLYDYRRSANGYRDNSHSDSQAQFISLQFQATRRLRLQAELGRSTYLAQLPGPLTDSMFYLNPRQATRSRNYFNPDIYVPSLRADWQVSDRTRVVATLSAVLGARNSVLIDAFANVPDMPDPQTGQYKSRQVDMDHFNSYTAEVRVLHHYHLVQVPVTALVGVQLMNNDLHRQQLGKGTTGNDFDRSLTVPGWGRDLHYYTQNVALFAESQFHLTPKLTVSPGIRIENGLTQMRGTISYYSPQAVPNDIPHLFALLGLSGQYQFTPQMRLYGGFSQAYRPVIFKDIIPASAYERVDTNLNDAHGYTLEAGLSGRWKGLNLNVGVFDLLYRNRLGSVVGTNVDGSSFVLRTNIGDSHSRGIEALVEADILRAGRLLISGFTSTAYLDARYQNAQVSTGTENRSVTGNRVETAPVWTSRNGLTLRYRTGSLTTQYSYVSSTFSDALNTPVPTANGAKGPVPAYGLWDVNATWRAGKHFTFRGSVSNLANKQYFTKRPTFYPGPGIWPSDGRSLTLSVGVRL